MTINEVFEFIEQHDLTVVSTVSDDAVPESAVVEFGVYGNLNVVIDTLTTSRKYKNLQTNTEVALVIGWDKDITVQVNASAHLLDGDELTDAKQSYFAKNPRAKKWDGRDDIVYFGFKPKWIRYSDVSQSPWQIEEFNL
jgi:pyridoxine/pyridoxamine 5'-phosphate oxidase